MGCENLHNHQFHSKQRTLSLLVNDVGERPWRPTKVTNNGRKKTAKGLEESEARSSLLILVDLRFERCQVVSKRLAQRQTIVVYLSGWSVILSTSKHDLLCKTCPLSCENVENLP